jgi:biotin carboxyl carrier protein
LTVLSAPIPGKVLRVSVAAGDRVQKRQSLMSLEAMKMENDIQAPRDALVEKVMVSQGQSVSAGTTLIVLR